MTWLAWLGLVLSLLAVTAAGLTAFGAERWTDRMAALARGLKAARTDGMVEPPYSTHCAAHYDTRELEGLPAPVQRYFRAVLKDGQAIVSAVAIEMAGTISMSGTTKQRKPFTFRQRVVTRRPGFMWHAQVSIPPGVKVHVLDGYIAGNGLLRAAMLGLFTVAEMSGGGEMARGEFMRFFAETPWCPTALLPTQGVHGQRRMAPARRPRSWTVA
jgi:hypothetical protein